MKHIVRNSLYAVGMAALVTLALGGGTSYAQIIGIDKPSNVAAGGSDIGSSSATPVRAASTQGPVVLPPGAEVFLDVGVANAYVCARNLQFAAGRVKTTNLRYTYTYSVAPFQNLCFPANSLGLRSILVSNVGNTYLEVTSRIFA